MRQISRVIAAALFLLAEGVLSATTVEKSLSKWHTGQRIEVVSNSGEKLVGRLGVVEADQFVLNPDNNAGVRRVIKIADVRSVKTKLTLKEKWLIAALVYVGVTVLQACTLGN